MAIGTNLTGLNTVEIATKAFNAYASAIAPRAVFSTKAEMSGKAIGDAVQVPYIPVSTATSAATTVVDYHASSADVSLPATVTLTNRVYDVVSMPATNFRPIAFEAAMIGKGQAVARKVQQFIYAKLLAATFTRDAKEIVSENAFVADDLADLNGQTLAWPAGQKSAVLSATAFTALTRDREFSLAMHYGDSAIVKGGKVPMAYGFEVHGDDLISSAIAAEKLVGFVATPQAIGVAMAPVLVPEMAANNAALYTGMITDETGYVLSVKIYYWPQTDMVYGVCEVLVGASCIDPKALIRIKTA